MARQGEGGPARRVSIDQPIGQRDRLGAALGCDTHKAGDDGRPRRLRPVVALHLAVLTYPAIIGRMAKRPPSLSTRATAQRKWRTTTRGSRTARGYGRAWDKLRALVLRSEPLCRHCKATGRAVVASTVDHITPKANGGGDELANLQPLCAPCHKAKTAREGQAARRR